MARVESRGRARALQALYAWDLRANDDLLRVSALIWDDLAVAADERAFAAALLRVVASDGAALDAELADVTMNWRLERIGAIERCVLRLGAAELHAGVTPPRVVLQESVRLPGRVGRGQSARFREWVVGAAPRRVGRLRGRALVAT